MKDITERFTELNKKFTSNLEKSLDPANENFSSLECKGRTFVSVGELLVAQKNLAPHQVELTKLFDELFADLVLSIYFASIALDRPAEMLLRRILELGVSVIYMWDMPHVYWGWKANDSDLNFQDMLAHLTSQDYKSYLELGLSGTASEHTFETKEINKLYRAFSNTIHGKISTVESGTKMAFSFDSGDWQKYLENANKVSDILFSLWFSRFPWLREPIAKQPLNIRLSQGEK